MSNNSPAKIFLESIGSLIKDASRSSAIFKHQTLEGRPGDMHAPGDPRGYRSAKKKGSQHHEVGGHPGELPTQEPHGLRGLDQQGSIQTLLILLRKAAQVFKDDSIADWNEYLTWADESVWGEGARIFGSIERVRELIDELPERGAGENINIDDVPEKLLRRYYVGDKTQSRAPVTPKKKKPPTKARELSPQEEAEINRAIKDLKALQEAERTSENQSEMTKMWLALFKELGLGQLNSEQLRNFFSLSFEEKLDVLEALLEGLGLGDKGI